MIDEAYSMMGSKNDQFGQEALDTLMALMEEYADNPIVILVGYSKEMDELLSKNPDMKSRIS
ncbi:AAA family ATPase [Priestia filamentosa]|uniref:AAA family ATPase n=1 Tax=Priestia filamentosa TaxID=1402861 RepID=UPI003982C980